MKERGKKKRQWLEPATWQMACHVLTNWATELFSNSVAKFEHLRPSSSQSGYQASMFDGEDATNARPGSVIYMLQGMGGGAC